MRARTWVIAVTSGGLGGVAGALAVTGTWWPLAVWVALWSLLLIRHGRIDRMARDEEMRLLAIELRRDENEES